MHGTVDQIGLARAHAPASDLILAAARSWPARGIATGAAMPACGVVSRGRPIVPPSAPRVLDL